MTTLPEEAVKAAADAAHEELMLMAKQMNVPMEYTQSISVNNYRVMRAALSTAIPFLPVQVAVKEVPLGAIENGRAFLQRLVDHYDFTCEAGPLVNCADYHEAVRCFEHIAQWISDLSALEPSAAREPALEEHLHAIEQQLAVNLGYFHDEKRFLLETLQAHITTRIAAIRALSSPDHADAGKVEGDGKKWPMREIVAKAIAYHSVGDPHAKTIRGDQRWEWFVEEADKFISVFGYYMPALPSAPSEGAE